MRELLPHSVPPACPQEQQKSLIEGPPPGLFRQGYGISLLIPSHRAVGSKRVPIVRME